MNSIKYIEFDKIEFKILIRIVSIAFLLIATCCSSGPDYSREIIGKWICVETKLDFDGPPDPLAYMVFDYTNNGVDFKYNNTCKGFDNDTTKYYIGGSFWNGTYRLNGDELTISEKTQYKIVSITETDFYIDRFITLEDYNFNFARLKKLWFQGTGNDVVIHYKFEKMN